MAHGHHHGPGTSSRRCSGKPFSHYYASMARDAMEADFIFVIGSGLGDLHLNTWLGQARRRDPPPPLVFVDYWSGSFRHATAFDLDRKEIEMIHELRMPFKDRGLVDYGTGWNLDERHNYAIWDKGFRAFLTASGELDHILRRTTVITGRTGLGSLPNSPSPLFFACPLSPPLLPPPTGSIRSNRPRGETACRLRHHWRSGAARRRCSPLI